MRNLVIYGTGSLAIQLHTFISNYSSDNIIGWIDDFRQEGELLLGKPILGNYSSLRSLSNQFDCIALGIGYNDLKKKMELMTRIQRDGYRMYTFVHPWTSVDPTARIAEGVFIYPGTIVDQRVQIGAGSLLNNGCVISHDTTIGSCCFFAPRVSLAGNVSVSDRCFLGTGAIANDGVKIVSDVYLGSGTLVIKDVIDSGKYVGGPQLRKLN